MTRSTSTSAVIVLGDTETGNRLEMLTTRAAECGMAIAETHTFETGAPGAQNDLSEVDAVVTALSRAVRTRANVWLPFPIDLLREEHVRRVGLVLQHHGLNLLVGRQMWACPLDGGINEIDIALRREVHAVDDLNRAVVASIGGQTLADEVELMLRAGDGSSTAPSGAEQLTDVLQRLEVQYGPHPGMPSTRAAWAVRQAGLRLFVGWLVHGCEMTRGEAADFLNAWGHRTRTGREWQRSTVSTLVNRRGGRSAV